MVTIKLNGKEHPYKFTIGAAKKFKEKFGVNVTNVDPTDLEQLQYIVYFGAMAGCKIEGKEFELTIEDLDALDISELGKLVEQTTPDTEKKMT